MSNDDGSNLDPSTIDLDAWIDGVQRPEVTVDLYPHEKMFRAKVEDIEKRLEVAERTKPENRGLDDDTPESLEAELAQLRDERSRSALRVRVRQITDAEMTEAVIKAKKAKASEKHLPLWGIAAACVEPTFTAEQLVRLYDRDVTGEAMVSQLAAAVTRLRGGLPTPS